MTLDDIRQRIAKIHELQKDDEAAHSEEDDLHSDVLKAIAEETCEEPVEAARLALTTEQITFQRYCA